ncbi:MAG: DNA repair protein RecN [Vicinamibacteria bacterium]|nr:DNA repair protein RecN [Vicinamibacteria bacterium]
MIKYLKIKNIALMPIIEIELGDGLTLLTGETGAGKSILIDALGLIIGTRGSVDLIRTGTDMASVEAIVDASSIRSFLDQHGLPLEGDEVIVRREILANGKGRASINGALVPISLLKELAPNIATIHGQHEPQGLLDVQTQRELLDAFAGLSDLAGEVRDRHRRWRVAETNLEEWRQDRREIERRRESLQFQLDEIERSRLDPGEDEVLLREKSLLANAERLAGLAEEAYEMLYDDESAALSRLVRVFRRVDELATIDPRFAQFAEARPSVQAHLEELALFLRDYKQNVNASPARLEEVERRLALLDRLKRKYGASVAEVIAFAGRCRDELTDLASPEEREKTLEDEREKTGVEYRDLALKLSRARRDAARDLSRRVRTELASLAMEKTLFEIRFNPEDLPGDPSLWQTGECGLESLEFMISPNPGEDIRSLARIASGGELSRIMLALKSVADVESSDRTLVFDEVDAGIGGRMAEVVGKKLKNISRRHQVLCVTHLPQIAAMADHHFTVIKKTDGTRTVTKIQALNGDDRVQEIARMLGGESVSETAYRHAVAMLRKNMN